MDLDRILTNLQAATTSDEKAAVVAEGVIADLSPEIAVVARRCGLLPMFTPDVIVASLDDAAEEVVAQAVKTITGLPFVEQVPWGWTYHSSTRRGMLAKCLQEQPDEILAAFAAAVPVLLDDWDNDEAALAALYGLVVTGQMREALGRCVELLSRFREREGLSNIVGVFTVLEEAESIRISMDSEMSAADWFVRGLARSVRGKSGEAIADLDRAIEMEPENPIWLSGRGKLYAVFGDLDRAVADLGRAIEIDPRSDAFCERAEVRFKQGEPDLALADYSKAIELEPENASVFRRRGDVYREEGQPDLAIADYTQAIRLDSRDVRSYLRRGGIYSDEEQFDRAIDDYSMVVEIESQNALSYTLRGIAFMAAGDLDRAIADYQKSVELDPQYAGAYGVLGDAYRAAGTCEEAIASYQQAIELDSQNVDYYRGLAFAARNCRRFDLAITACERIVEIEPDDVSAHNNLGYLYIHEGKLAEAKTHLDQALVPEPQYSYALLNSGILQWRLGQIQEARSLFREALRAISRTGRPDQPAEGWLQVVTGAAEAGLERIRSYIADSPDFGALYNLWDWTNFVLLGDVAAPSGLEEIAQMVSERLPLLSD